jgi:hypothetical protein
MQIPDTARGLLAELADTPAAPPALRGRIIGYDPAELIDHIEIDAGGERVLVHALANGYLAIVTPLPWPYTQGDVAREVARLYDYPPLFCERRRVARPAE